MRICHVRRQANDLSSDSNGRLILARCGECRPDGVITVELLSQRLVPRTLWGLPLRLCKRLAEARTIPSQRRREIRCRILPNTAT
jgi:hypothetical protein